MLNDINKEFRILSAEEKILSDALDWQQPIEDWKERTATQISTEIFEETGQKIKPQGIGKALKNMGYAKDANPKTLRMLHGYTLYLTPTPKSGLVTEVPYENQPKGKAFKVVR